MGFSTCRLEVESGSPGELVLRLDLPAPRPGVVIRATVAIHLDGGVLLTHRLWIFPEDPFVERRAALESMKITLFDPEKNTAAVFQRAKIPFRAVRDVAGLSAAGEGLIVVGEGASPRQWRGLPRALIDAAARGLPVLWLAPAAGTIPLPGVGDRELPAPREFLLRQAEVITAFDKRLDTVWPPDGKTAAARIELAASRAGIFGEMSAGERGWPWLEIACPVRSGRLLFCGFGIIAKWESGPTPRYLLAHLLGRLSGQAILPAHSPTGELLRP